MATVTVMAATLHWTDIAPSRETFVAVLVAMVVGAVMVIMGLATVDVEV